MTIKDRISMKQIQRGRDFLGDENFERSIAEYAIMDYISNEEVMFYLDYIVEEFHLAESPLSREEIVSILHGYTDDLRVFYGELQSAMGVFKFSEMLEEWNAENDYILGED